MAVSIWEGNKAQELIDAIKQTNKIDKQQGTANAGKALVVGSDGLVGFGNAGISDKAKSALLACFQNVVWTTDKGKDLYDDLRDALYESDVEPEPDPEWGTDYTWLYRADRDGVFSSNSNLSGVSQQGTPIEAISDGLLNVQVTNGAQIYKINPLTSSNAILKAKVRFKSLPASTSPTGFRMQVSNGTVGAQIFAFKHAQADVYSLRTNTGNVQAIVADAIDLNKWYIISCELKNGKQILTIDGNESQFDGLSSYACTESRVIVQSPDNNACNVDVAWITFKNND